MENSNKNEPRWERRKDARPSELCAAALSLFVEKGFAATRLEDIAIRAGVSKATLYLYFDGKEALFKEVVRANLLPALAQSEQKLADFQGSSAELLHLLIQNWWQVIDSSAVGGLPKLMISEAQNFPALARFYHDEVIVRGKNLLARILERGIRRGEFRSTDMKTTVEAMLGPMLLMALWKYSFAPLAPDEFEPALTLRTAVDLFLNGLRHENA
ncbi:MAG TPA: TetR/AcrR family transcriptional regulator [Burkholderiales bacterium]|nr:TetR/AcrR family transcriptional regulator [Burkholderiales bacterium]